MPLQSKNHLRKIAKGLLWIFFLTSLFLIMRFIENVQPFSTIISPLTDPLASKMFNTFLIAFFAVPFAIIPFTIYRLANMIYGKNKTIEGVFYIIFTIWFYPFEYTFMRFIFLFREVDNLPPIFKSEAYTLLIVIGGLTFNQFFNKTSSVTDMWNKVLGGQLIRLAGYFIIFLITFILIVLLHPLVKFL